MAVTSYGAALISGGGGYVIAAGHLGGQTVIGATQSGGDLTLQDNATNVGGLIHLGSGGVIDRTGPTPRFGILTFTPQHAFDCPADVAFRGLGTGPLSVVNDVLQVGAGGGGGSGGGWTENLSGTPAVAVTPDNVTVGTFDANQSEISKLLVDASPADTISSLLALAVGGVPAFLVGTDGRVAIGTNILPSTPVVEIRGFPLQFVGQADHVLEIPSYTPAAGSATGEYLPVKVGANLRLVQLLASFAVSASDTFAGAGRISAATLNTSSGGQLWAPQVGTWGVDANNRAYCVTDAGTFSADLATLAGQAATGTITATLAVLADTQGITWRGSYGGTNATDAYYFAHYKASTGGYTMGYFDGSTATQIGAASTGFTPASGDMLRAVLAPATPKLLVQVSQNGGQTWTTIYTSNTTDEAGVLSHNTSSVLHGLHVQTAGQANARWGSYTFTGP